MRPLRSSLLAAVLAGASLSAGLGLVAPSDARASVSIAVGYEALVKDADAVAVVTPVESKSVWEEGRIITYTRVKVEQSIAGDLGAGAEGWVRTMGGVVDKIGQLVDGEPVFTNAKSSLVFLRKFSKLNTSGTWEVSARAQGQFPIVDDASVADKARARRVMRSAAVGVLLPPKSPTETVTAGPPAPPSVATKTDPNAPAAESAAKARLAGEVLHDRPLDDVTRDIVASWKKLHPAVTPATPKK